MLIITIELCCFDWKLPPPLHEKGVPDGQQTCPLYPCSRSSNTFFLLMSFLHIRSICHYSCHYGLIYPHDKNLNAKVNVWIPIPWIILLLFNTFPMGGYGVSSHSDLCLSRWLSYPCVVHLDELFWQAY